MKSDRCVTVWLCDRPTQSVLSCQLVSLNTPLACLLLSLTGGFSLKNWLLMMMMMIQAERRRTCYCSTLQLEPEAWFVTKQTNEAWVLRHGLVCLSVCLSGLTDDIVLTAQHKHWTRLKLSRLLSWHSTHSTEERDWPANRNTATLEIDLKTDWQEILIGVNLLTKSRQAWEVNSFIYLLAATNLSFE